MAIWLFYSETCPGFLFSKNNFIKKRRLLYKSESFSIVYKRLRIKAHLMNTPNEQLSVIILKKEHGEALSAEEELLYQQWKETFPQEMNWDQLEPVLKSYFQLEQEKERVLPGIMDLFRQKIAAAQVDMPVAQVDPPMAQKKRRINGLVLLAGAAILVAMLYSAWYLWLRPLHKSPTVQRKETPIRRTDTIRPDMQAITLTLAHGKQIVLGKQDQTIGQQGRCEVMYKNGMLIYEPLQNRGESSADSFNTIQVPAGLQCAVKMPDGSVALLNAQASLKIPLYKDSSVRRVDMTGEITFTVQEDLQVPFIVHTRGIEVKATGTVFTVVSYEEEAFRRVILHHGGIIISNGKLIQPVLQPQVWQANQHQVQMVTSNREKVADLIATIDARKRGVFYFKAATLAEIVPELEHWYNMKLENRETLSFSHLFHIPSISRSLPLEELAKKLEGTKTLKISVKDHTFHITLLQ